jgi:large subunit ribosomal protein L4
MDLTVTTLEGKDAGKISLSDAIFRSRPAPGSDPAHRALAARQEAAGHPQDARPFGNLAHRRQDVQAEGHRAAPVTMRAHRSSVAVARRMVPIVRSHAHDLPKKVRALALRHALSAKAQASDIIVVDNLTAGEAKTKALTGSLSKLGLTNALFIGGAELDQNFRLAAKNIPNVDVLPVQGINVYDILRRGKLVLSKDAIAALEERFK